MGQPRFMIAGTNSGCGKTTITCGLMKALMNRGLRIAPFKCGPDYIDPMFHTHITGVDSVNLDLFFVKEDMVNWLLKKHMDGMDLGIIEGVMGYYDGIGTTLEASSYDLAVKTKTPVVLVVNAKGMSISIIALIKGYQSYGGCDMVRGVILNNVSKGTYLFLKDAIESQTGVRVLGYFERQEQAVIESRHLGLVTAEEIEDLDEKVRLLGEIAEQTVDIDGLLEIAGQAVNGPDTTPETVEMLNCGKEGEPFRLGVARDKAFCFYYKDNLKLMEEMGARLVYFSPMEDVELPPDLQGLYLGGGYPEVYSQKLSNNRSMRLSIKNAILSGLPVIAECGGFMYLSESIIDGTGHVSEMVGAIEGGVRLTKRLGPFGYVDLTTEMDSVLGSQGTGFKGHEFHYSAADNNGAGLLAVKPGGKKWTVGHLRENLYAGYPHLYFYSSPRLVLSIVKAMRNRKPK